jgi:hypothetical protein
MSRCPRSFSLIANVVSFTMIVLLAAASGAQADVGLTTTLGSADPSPGARTVPNFRDSFTFGGVTYPYAMVGTNPRTSHATTTVPTEIVPLRFLFADGNVSNPGTTVSNVAASPIFQSASFTSGTTQYGDAIRRAMFWQYVGGTDYHVLQTQPVVLPTQTIKVPRDQGIYLQAGAPIGPPSLGIHTAAPIGVVSERWFDAAFTQLVSSLKLDPTTLPILLSRNVALSGKPIPYGLPTLGFHSAASSTVGSGNQQVQTSIWASYFDPYFAAEFPSITQDTDVVSHEVSEWLHDPFIRNTVPSWQSPLPLASIFYGCNPFLETGDAVADIGFEVNGYQLQDEAFLSWFAHQVPSIGINGQYTYLGTFTEPSPLC